MRWMVETKPDVFSDVGAPNMGVHDSGALVFFDGDLDHPILVLAPGTWLAVTPEDDE